MEMLFIYIFLALAGIAGLIFLLISSLGSSDNQEKNFTSDGASYFEEPIAQAQREEDAYEDRQSSILSLIARKAPGLILTFILVNISTNLLTGYMSLKNAERIAMAGSAASQGDYGSAAVSLFTMAKPELKEQTNIARGEHPYLDKKGLHNFSYVGK